MSKIELSKYFPDNVVNIIYNKIYSTSSSRIELSKHFPDDVVKLIQGKLLPEKIENFYNVLQELLNKHYNTDNKQYCLKCHIIGCEHLMVVFAQNYNILRIMSGLSGLSFST